MWILYCLLIIWCVGEETVPETSVDDELDDYFYYEEDEIRSIDEMGPPPLLAGDDDCFV